MQDLPGCTCGDRSAAVLARRHVHQLCRGGQVLPHLPRTHCSAPPDLHLVCARACVFPESAVNGLTCVPELLIPAGSVLCSLVAKQSLLTRFLHTAW